MERTGVSRTPVREGLRMLEGEGLVITYRSRGTFVTYRLTSDEAPNLYLEDDVGDGTASIKILKPGQSQAPVRRA